VLGCNLAFSHSFFFRSHVASRSVEYAGLVGRDHVLNVDESIFATVGLEEFEGVLDEVTEVESLALAVVDLVTEVSVVLLEEVHDGEDLAVVGDKGLTDGVGAGDEGLQDLEGDGDDLGVTGVEGSYIGG
jgi:hypothetical protein